MSSIFSCASRGRREQSRRGQASGRGGASLGWGRFHAPFGRLLKPVGNNSGRRKSISFKRCGPANTSGSPAQPRSSCTVVSSRRGGELASGTWSPTSGHQPACKRRRARATLAKLDTQTEGVTFSRREFRLLSGDLILHTQHETEA